MLPGFPSMMMAAAGGVVYEAESIALFARMTTGPNAGRKLVVNSLIKSLKDAGVWAKLDALYLYAAADSQAALLNWKSTSYTGVIVYLTSFTADRGYTIGGQISTQFIPGTALSPQYTRNSAHISVWSRSAFTTTGYDFGNSNNGSPYSLITSMTSGAMFAYINADSGGSLGSVTDGSGHFILNRSGSAAVQGYRNGTLLGTRSDGSSGVESNYPFYLGTYTLPSPSKEFAAASIGGSLTSAEATAFSAAMQSYMISVGA